jgi:hypothetical protein
LVHDQGGDGPIDIAIAVAGPIAAIVTTIIAPVIVAVVTRVDRAASAVRSVTDFDAAPTFNWGGIK